MLLPRLLQFFMAALAALGTSMLGISQHDGVFPVLGIFVAVTSFWFTDVLRWFWINRTFGNALALGAIAYAVYDFYFRTIDDDLQLLAIANLLVYLQMILLYQQKSERRYWEIVALSLLQVVVAAALNLSVAFGALLIVYMLVAFTALGLFFVFRESLRLETTKRAGEVQPLSIASQAPQRYSLQRQLLGNPPEVAAGAPRLSWQSMLGWDFSRQVAGVSLLTLGFAVVLFFVIPRTGSFSSLAASNARVGFNAEVNLGEVGLLQQSNEIAMRVEFSSPEDDSPREFGSVYLTGNILTAYVEGHWTNAVPTNGAPGKPSNVDEFNSEPAPLAPAPRDLPVLWQRITLYPRNDRLLFSTLPVFAAPESTNQLRYTERGRLIREKRGGTFGDTSTYPYVVATAAFGSGQQATVTPYRRGANKTDEMVASDLQRLAELRNPLRFSSIVSKANAIAARRASAPNDRMAIVESLLDHFKLPGAYTYTLDSRNVPRDANLDPVEDFVLNHHSGHCEHFATALCLMLRSQNIPSRVVVGYLSSDYNSVGDFYQVREREAHAWVEAYLEPSQIPPGSLPPGITAPDGGWLRLDPTPADANAGQSAESRSLLARARDAFNVAQLLWDEYVLGLDAEQQQRTMSEGWVSVVEFFSGVFSFHYLRETADRALRTLGLSRDAYGIPWRAGLAAVVIGGVSLLTIHVLGLLMWKIRRMWARRSEQIASVRPPLVDFYVRLEKLLESIGIKRLPGQTQREFARAASIQLSRANNASDVSEVPTQIVEAFYDVRFGDAALSGGRAEAIAIALERLAAALAPTNTIDRRLTT